MPECQKLKTVGWASMAKCDSFRNWALTLSPPIPLRLYTLPYWSNPPFLIFDVRALRPERQSARMSKTKNGGLDQYGTKHFEQQQFGTAGVEGVKWLNKSRHTLTTETILAVLR